MNFDKGLIKEFVTETKEHLESLEDDFLALESQKETPEKDLIDNIFRVIHTIKGNAGFFQLKNIGDLSHVMETILSHIRNGKLIPTPTVIDNLLNGIDLVNSMLDDIQASDKKDISETVNSLNTILEEAGMAKPKGEKTVLVPLVDVMGKYLDHKVDEEILAMIPQHHDFLYCLKYDLKEFLLEKKMSPVSLVDKLTKTGNIQMSKIISKFKDLHEGLPAEMKYCVLYSTVLEPSLIEEASMTSSDNIQQIDLQGLRNKLATKELVTEEIITRFISETGDFIDKIENFILEIEQNPSNLDVVGEAFRLVHSIKGNAGFFQFTSIEQKAMQIESVLSEIRGDSSRVTSKTITTMLNLLDAIRKDVDYISVKKKQAGSNVDAGTLLGEILIDMGAVSHDSLESALKKQDRRLGEILVDEHLANEEMVHKAIELQNKLKGDDHLQYSSYAVKRKDIRVDIMKLDALFDLMGELVTAEGMLLNHPELQGLDLPGVGSTASYLSKITREMQEIIMSIRMVPLEGLFNKMRRLVRDLSRQFHKKINFFLSGQETEMDRNVIEMLSDPLIHIVRNAVDHGIEKSEARTSRGKDETGAIRLHAKYEGNEVWITVEDDGKGLDREKIRTRAVEVGLLKDPDKKLNDDEVWQFIFEPGFSTAAKVSKISGRGVGLDVVKRNIEKLRGKIDVLSADGEGTTIILKIPLTLAIIEGVVAKVGNLNFAIPINDISEFHKASESQLTRTNRDKEVLKLREHIIPVINLSTYFKVTSELASTSEGIIVISMDAARNRVGFLVDEILSYQQIVIKALPEYLDTMRGVSGCSISSSGDVNLIIDTHTVINDSLG